MTSTLCVPPTKDAFAMLISIATLMTTSVGLGQVYIACGDSVLGHGPQMHERSRLAASATRNVDLQSRVSDFCHDRGVVMQAGQQGCQAGLQRLGWWELQGENSLTLTPEVCKIDDEPLNTLGSPAARGMHVCKL